MKQKALVIGALPSPFEGPWVEFGDRAKWRVRPLREHIQRIRLVIEDSRIASPTSVVFDGQKEIVFSGERARVEILEEFDGRSVTIVAEEVVNGVT